ncbi:MAG TPA: hypothetical protein VK157_15105 [Phycisphaerales bacterium]|nr:hypothetical protein [Phycisphaerales bacterium]
MPAPLATLAGVENEAAVTGVSTTGGTGGGITDDDASNGTVAADVLNPAGVGAGALGALSATGGASAVVVAGLAGRYGAPGTMSVLLQPGHVMKLPDIESGDCN